MHTILVVLILINLTTTTTSPMILSTAVRRVARSSIYAIAFGNQGAAYADEKLEKLEKRIDLLSNAIVRTIDEDDKVMDEKITKRVLDYYIPVALWLESQILKGKKTREKGAVCVGLSLPQGAGKTTLADSMTNALATMGYRVAVVSYDDFYLTRKDQESLQRLHKGNSYLHGRGVAGTHDIALGNEILNSMTSATSETILVPRYDKTRFDGQGDRMPRGKWHTAHGPLDLVILEGWMLGFDGKDISRDTIRKQFPGMEVVHDYIGKYDSWISKLDAALIAGVEDINIVYKWREEAEKKNRDQGLGAMSSEEVKVFCDRYMPSYRTYAPKLYAEGIRGVSSERTLQFMLNAEREPVVSACPAEMSL